MFSSSKDSNNKSTSAEFNILATGSVVNGEINTVSDFRIDGTVNGPVTTKGRVVIGEKGVLIGELTAPKIDIAGTVKGKIICSDDLIFRSTAVIECDITTKTITIEPGAKLDGTCSMVKQANDKPVAK